MGKGTFCLLGAVAAVGIGCGSTPNGGASDVTEASVTAAVSVESDAPPDGRHTGPRTTPARQSGGHGSGGGTNGIAYHGGPVMLGTTHVYLIWYGAWSGNSATAILPDLVAHLGGSPYFAINTTYFDGSGRHVANAVALGGQTSDSYSRGTSLSDSDVLAVVTSAITSGSLPADASGAYYVLSSADVTAQSGFCTSYCGWHTHAPVATSGGALDVKYAFVGNPDRCPSACEEQTTSPNGNAGADGMASIVAHELDEMVTDPDLDAWYDRRGDENADKCAWTFGAESTAANGSKYNVTLGSRQYLIQQNWVDASGGYCALKL